MKRHRRPYTKAENTKIESLLESGHSYGQIAKRLGRTTRGIEVHCRNVLRITIDGLIEWNEQKVAELMGVSNTTVSRWIAKGYLKGLRPPGSQRWRFTDDDLSAFIEAECYWPIWDPRKITDLAWREYAIEVRGGKEFIKSPEAAALLGYTTSRMWTLMNEGRIKPVWIGRDLIFLRTDVERFRFVPRSVGRACRRFTAEEDRFILERAAVMKHSEIAREIGRSKYSITERIRVLRKRAVQAALEEDTDVQAPGWDGQACSRVALGGTR